MYLVSEIERRSKNEQLLKQLNSGVCPHCAQRVRKVDLTKYRCYSCGYWATLNYDVVSYLKDPRYNK